MMRLTEIITLFKLVTVRQICKRAQERLLYMYIYLVFTSLTVAADAVV